MTKIYKTYLRPLSLLLLMLGFLVFLSTAPKQYAQSQNCSLNIYPEPVNGTNDYTVTFTNNTSTPFKGFLNNWYGGNDTIGNGGTGSINSRTYPAGWTPLDSQSYEVRASNATGAQQVVYQLNLTLNNGFGGIDVGASSDEAFTSYDLCSGHISPSEITYNQ